MTTHKELTSIYAQHIVRDIGLRALVAMNDTVAQTLGFTMSAQQTVSALSEDVAEQTSGKALRQDTDLFILASQMAEHALVSGIENPESIAAYNAVSKRDSAEHTALTAYQWDETQYLNRTLQLMSDVVTPTACRAVSQITAALDENRARFDQSGQVSAFNWGLLSDPMFTHAVLNYANQSLKIFDPDQKVTPYYATVAFAQADARNLIENTSRNELEIIRGYLSMADIEGIDDTIEHLLCRSDSLQTLTAHLKNDSKDPRNFVRNVERLAEVHGQYLIMANHLDNHPDDVPEELKHRATMVGDILMCLEVAVEALRETVYNDALVMCVEFPEDEPQIVVINDDNLDTFTSEGYELDQLVPITAYMQMDADSVQPQYGRTLDWYRQYHTDIAQAAIEHAEQVDEQNRLKHVRAGYGIIQTQLNDLVTQFNDGRDMTPAQQVTIHNEIEKIVASSRDEGFDLTHRVVHLLNMVVGFNTDATLQTRLESLSDAADTQQVTRILQNAVISDLVSDFYNA